MSDEPMFRVRYATSGKVEEVRKSDLDRILKSGKPVFEIIKITDPDKKEH